MLRPSHRTAMTPMHTRWLRTTLLALLFCGAAAANELEQAQALFEQGKTGEAAQKVDQWLKAQPKDPNARFLRGLIQYRQGQLDEAIATFNALTKDFPHLPEPYNNLAVIYAGRGEYDQAITALQSAIRTHPSYATAHENLGDIYARKASEAYEQALNLDKKNKTVETKLAMLHGLFPQGGKPPAKPSPATSTQPSSSPPPAPAAAQAEKPAAKPTAGKPVPIAAVSPVAEPTTPAPAAEPSPAAKPPSPATAVPDDAASKISGAVHAWADAWSSKDMARYLAAYASDFKPGGGLSRAAWETQREQRITGKPGAIQVAVEDLRLSAAEDGAVWASFRQTYRSGNLHERTLKRLLLAQREGQWKILREETGAR